MLCPSCGVEMWLKERDGRGNPVYQCPNPKCPTQQISKEEI